MIRLALGPYFRRLALALALAMGVAPAFADEVVLIPNRVIYPGETIGLAALKEVTLGAGKRKPQGVVTVAADLEGKIAKRTLLPGRYIPATALRDAWLVEQGAPVLINFVVDSLSITASAISLQPGSAGDLIKVRNVDSGKVLTGTVMADGTIRVSAS
ncbi:MULTISPECIES: flagellar basal body P-ring formation chaperone FlgA [Phyllobacteriaceae]|jgi:flagellar basal body P-ring formation protein FlgA|uniref:Flagella basal body P-ring formation protein FlgA n=1 Tax=Mesorhizobium hungaricum TaxID=1566387 RepID=A0A1C2EA90_9HYPH|nr:MULTISPECIES: flagellar basal body P-ring formation chaperone FlgA [Mesorhizobium]MBN9237138.1 flagellar basal body P-ring formation protein FlgA [Mesorhizobium sp.]MDQ0329342.1 flagella basal body P-ring formation protein FlgA [Mesorhizobium sp. YL-MeA3-2017]OCX23900.1 flagella basal body P-ring formation protein FlgA [Mesorhizobium hungaricum]